MMDLRDNDTFRSITKNGLCWVCGEPVALLIGWPYPTANGERPSCCYVSITDGGFYRRCYYNAYDWISSEEMNP